MSQRRAQMKSPGADLAFSASIQIFQPALAALSDRSQVLLHDMLHCLERLPHQNNILLVSDCSAAGDDGKISKRCDD
jgi:hypothetical protein